MAGNFIVTPPHDLSTLPPPPVSGDVDLRTFGDMPIEVRAVRDSELAAGDDDAAKWTAFMLWCAAWHQLPAGSLPNDMAQVARLAGFGKDVRGFKRRSKIALRGYQLASDGRLHHVMAAKKVLKAWKSKNSQKEKSDKRWKKHKPLNKNKSPDAAETPSGQPVDNATAHAPGYAGGIPLSRGDILSPPYVPIGTPGSVDGPEGPTDPAPGRSPRANGTNPRAEGINPRALGTNPTALGENPRALGTNPRATGDNPRAQLPVEPPQSRPPPKPPVSVDVLAKSGPPPHILKTPLAKDVVKLKADDG